MFDKFPTIVYDGRILTDISRRLSIHKYLKDNIAIFETHIINEGQKIEDIALKYYSDPKYHILIMIMNDIIDPFYDWVLSSKELLAYVDEKYVNDGGRFGVHHYELDGNVVDEFTVGAASVSNLNYEELVNEAKRKIKILRPEYTDLIKQELETILNE